MMSIIPEVGRFHRYILCDRSRLRRTWFWIVQSAEHCESRIHSAVNKIQWDKTDAQCTRMSMECEEALQVRHAWTRCPVCSTCKHNVAGLATAISTRRCPWGRKSWHSQSPGSSKERICSVPLGKNVPLYLLESHATWQEGAPHRLALTRQIPTQPLLLAAFQSRTFTRINCSEQFLQYTRYKYSFLPISHAGLPCTNTVASKGKIFPSSYAKCLRCSCGQFMGVDGEQDDVPQGTGSLQHFVPAHLLSGRKPVPEILSFSKEPATRTQQVPVHNPCWWCSVMFLVAVKNTPVVTCRHKWRTWQLLDPQSGLEQGSQVS